MSSITIRTYRQDDAVALAEVFFEAVRVIGRRDYSAEQVAAWAPAPPSPEVLHRRLGDGRLVFVATAADGEPIGFGDLEHDGHIDMLFCRSDHAGRGVGGALCDSIEAAAQAGRLSRLFVEASEGARRLFERRGFVLVARQNLERSGVAIHNYRMEKMLRAADAIS
jgi:putative acetyltransferase